MIVHEGHNNTNENCQNILTHEDQFRSRIEPEEWTKNLKAKNMMVRRGTNESEQSMDFNNH